MLVYFKEPMAYANIEGQRVYGKYFARGVFGPTKVSRDTYFKYQDIFENFEYTSEWFARKYNKEFPSIKFDRSNFWTIDFTVVIELAKLIGIDYRGGQKREFSDIEKRALRRSILARIEDESKYT